MTQRAFYCRNFILVITTIVLIVWILTFYNTYYGERLGQNNAMNNKPVSVGSKNKSDEKQVLGVKEQMKKLNDEKQVLDVKEQMKILNDEKVDQSDPRLIKLIRDHYILPPNYTRPYNLKHPNKVDYSGQGKDFLVPNTVKDLPGKGFFIECGANDGEFLSSTLYFEREKKWSGLLIEAHPALFNVLKQRNRKAYALNACLNTKPYPSVMRFNLNGAISRLIEGTLEEAYRYHTWHGFKIVENVVEIQCFPLYSVLLALNQTKVDFFGLDVEGAEYGILKTVPWSKVDISIMLVEKSHQDDGGKAMQAYLEGNGYNTLKIVREDILVQKK